MPCLQWKSWRCKGSPTLRTSERPGGPPSNPWVVSPHCESSALHWATSDSKSSFLEHSSWLGHKKGAQKRGTTLHPGNPLAVNRLHPMASLGVLPPRLEMTMPTTPLTVMKRVKKEDWQTGDDGRRAFPEIPKPMEADWCGDDMW